MTVSGDTIPADRLRDVVGRSGRSDSAAATADRALISLGSTGLPVSLVPKAALEEIYRRRLARPGFDAASVPGSERVLDDLARYGGDRVATIAVEHEGSIVIIWLDSVRRGLVSVMVGRDHRDASVA
jgi:hypothetical protein